MLTWHGKIWSHECIRTRAVVLSLRRDHVLWYSARAYRLCRTPRTRALAPRPSSGSLISAALQPWWSEPMAADSAGCSRLWTATRPSGGAMQAHTWSCRCCW
eukprot:366445-Chlamydomonas_euryale.AAC.12